MIVPPRLELQSITARFERPTETDSHPGESGAGKVSSTGFALPSTMKTCLADGTHNHRGRRIPKEHGQMPFVTKGHDDLDTAIPMGG